MLVPSTSEKGTKIKTDNYSGKNNAIEAREVRGDGKCIQRKLDELPSIGVFLSASSHCKFDYQMEKQEA